MHTGIESRSPRMGKPHEIAALIAYVGSEPTGYLTVDGGLRRPTF